MFGIGFFELLLIAIAVLLLFGPERLPELLRQVGQFVAQVKNYSDDARDSVERMAEEIKDSHHDGSS